MRRIFAVLFISLFVFGCGKKEDQKLDLAVRPVNYKMIEDETMVQEREFSATIVPEVLTEISFRVSGTLKKRIADLGEKVKKGQILATLDPTDYQIEYNRVKAFYSKAKSAFERDRSLYLENSISKAEYENSLAEYKTKEAELAATKKQLDYTELRATNAGEIAEVRAEVNETVNAGQPIYVLNELGGLEVTFSVSDILINSVKLKDQVQIVINSTNETLQGQISNIGSVSNAYGRAYPVKAKIINPSKNIKPGMTANVKLKISGALGQTVPLNSVLQSENGQKYVFVITQVKDDIGVVAKQTVTVGTASPEGVQISSGVTKGDMVITSGAAVVFEGQKVKLGERE
ncbi:MAG: efflux RND transporter periplasmic adaptor subunit [Fusobacteriaceae bacterium]